MRNAKIVCTLGPASDTLRGIEDLVDAGMSVARINASHGALEDSAALVETVRTVDGQASRPLATMLDLQGPEIRTISPTEPVELHMGDEVRFVEGTDVDAGEIGLSERITAVEPRARILLDDGRIETTVVEIDGEAVVARVVSGGTIEGRTGVNVPGVDLDLDVVTDQDRRYLELAASADVDFVAASFVRDAGDVYAVNAVLEEFGADIPIVAKIERADAVTNLKEIVEASYGIMVARGDLGVECPMEDVPMIQKRIIRACREAGVPVITATEMLDSMVHARRPTRAEASDVANAVLDGTDAVMLSAETAVGDHPVRVVETMDRIIREVESSDEYAELREQRVPRVSDSRTDALARAARYLARDLGASAVIAASESGYTALKTAKYRPQVPVVASTPSDRVQRRLALSWGVIPEYVPFNGQSVDVVIKMAVQTALDAGVAESGDTVVILSGMLSELKGSAATNTLKVHVAAETVATGRSVASGRVSGPLVRSDDGDLSTLPDGAIIALGTAFEGEFTGNLGTLAGIVDARPGMTGYPAMVARELDIPMISGAVVDEVLADGAIATLDAERGVLYEGKIETGSDESDE